jgi:hypothetical protein
MGCMDPPSPPPVDGPRNLPRWSQAPYVRWADLDDASPHPVAVFVDEPGGPLDRLAADHDVTTFLNDRFQPFFLVPDDAPLPRGVTFLDRRGCVLEGPASPASAAELVALANRVQLDLSRGAGGTAIAPTPWSRGASLAAGHPLRIACAP